LAGTKSLGQGLFDGITGVVVSLFLTASFHSNFLFFKIFKFIYFIYIYYYFYIIFWIDGSNTGSREGRSIRIFQGSWQRLVWVRIVKKYEIRGGEKKKERKNRKKERQVETRDEER